MTIRIAKQFLAFSVNSKIRVLHAWLFGLSHFEPRELRVVATMRQKCKMFLIVLKRTVVVTMW